MATTNLKMIKMRVIFTVIIFTVCIGIGFSQVSLTTLGSAYTQDFNTLASSGTTSSVMPSPWVFVETGSGANTSYGINNGSDNAGNTYSYGTTSAAERAMGELNSNSLTSIAFGANFTNNTGSTINSLVISFRGEQWRKGANGAVDTIKFSYSTDATSLTTGTFTNLSGLSFITPNTGASNNSPLDGNASPNFTNLSFTLNGLSISNSSTFWIKFNSVNITGTDDGLSIDNFSLTPNGCSPVSPIISGVTSVCSGGNVTLDAGSGYSAYAWSNSGGVAQTAMFSNITSNTTYTVTVTDANGCTGTDTHSVAVNANPSPNITGPTSVCSGGSVTLDAGLYALYDWSNSGGSNQTATFSNITTMTTYTVTVVDNNSCIGTDVHTVSVNALPVATAGSNSPVCPKTTLTLTGGADGNNYSWSGPDMFTSMIQNPTIANVSALKAGLYVITVTDGNMCTNTASTTVVVNPVPVILPLTTARCSNAQWGFGLPAITQNGVPVNALSVRTLTAASGLTLINSQIPPMLPATGLAAAITLPEVWQNPTSNPLDVIYTVSATADGLCYGDSVEVKVTINPLPTAMISGGSIICANQTSTLTASGGSTFEWSNGGMTNSINVGIGSYSVTVTDGNGCTDTESYTINQNNTNNNGTSGIYESYVIMNTTGSNIYYDLQNPTVNQDFNGFNLGTFPEGGSALINGGEIKTYKNNPANICGGRIYYSVYPSAGMPGSFTTINLPFAANLGGPNQQWSNTTSNNNFLASLTPGTYKIAVYVDASGDGLNPSGCGCDPLHVQNNTGAYWVADFSVCGGNAGTISGNDTICVDGTTDLNTNGDTGGSWSSNNNSVATVNSVTGVVTGESAGSATITYTIAGAMGCPDVSADTTIVVNSLPNATIAFSNVAICAGETAKFTITGTSAAEITYKLNAGPDVTAVLDVMGEYVVNVPNVFADITLTLVKVKILSTDCETVINLDSTVMVNFPNTGSQMTTECDMYTWPANGNTYMASGTYMATLTNAAGCDSIVTLNLTINNSNTGSETQQACDTYTWPVNNSTYTMSGNYMATLTNAVGCDSVVTLNLTINNSNTGMQTESACNSYTWSANGMTYTMSGTYMTTLTNAVGCDSVVTLNLAINTSNTGMQTETACNSYTWPANGMTYMMGGNYTTTLTNAAGCDSVVTLNLTINNSNTGMQTESACNSYTWPTNGMTYMMSGNYTATLTNTAGCDSVVTLNLTINASNTGMQTETACNSYLWSANGMTYMMSGNYTATLTNAAGCDSVVTLNLTINTSNTGMQTETSCNSYLWSANGMTYMMSGNYTATLTNAAGCDSVVTLNLTINNSNTGNQTETECNSYTWPTNGMTYTMSGSYMAILTNAAGCDSVVTLNLTINYSNNTQEFVTACTPYIWSADGNTYSMTGVYDYIITNVMTGCEDTATLNLTFGTSAIENNNNPSCYTTIADALNDAMPGDTVSVNAGTYIESFEVGKDVILIINTSSNVSNSGVICNMGKIILNGGQFINTSAYQGRGIFVGDFVNTSTGSISPKVCGN